ncbi:MAG: hypothetical protein Q8M83_00045 [bacterium]|nr:hypothetical protein [bacterium]
MKKPLDPITKIDLDEAFEQYDEKNRGYKDEVLTGLDSVMKELETMREESTIGVHQTRELREDVDDHEKRITKLESPTQ